MLNSVAVMIDYHHHCQPTSSVVISMTLKKKMEINRDDKWLSKNRRAMKDDNKQINMKNEIFPEKF